MEMFITVIHTMVALFLILVVLVQGGNSGGVGAAFGGGNTQGVFGASGATSFLGKLTYFGAAIFMVSSILLTIYQGSGKTGLTKKLETATQEEAKTEPAAAGATAPEAPAVPAQ